MNVIGIIGAMDEEVSILVDLMDIRETIKKASLEFYKGILEGKNVVLVKCGIGKVNSALCAQILISEFKVDAIVNTGVAGALNEKLDVNDIVISTDAIQYDVDTTAFGDPKGVIPRMKTSVFKADKFINSKELKEELVNDFGGYCGEMEGGAIAHVCYLNNTPFVIIRAMSDKADGSADVTYDVFVHDAANNSKDIVLNMLKSI